MDKEFENFKETLALSLYVFYHRLNSLYETYSDRTSFLFLARAGITIKKHLELFRKYYFQSEKSVGDVVWINRNIVTNSIFIWISYIPLLPKIIYKFREIFFKIKWY